MHLVRRSIAYLESVEAPLWYLVFTFIAIVTLRNVVELLITPHRPRFDAELMFNYSLFYIALVLSLWVLIHLLSKETPLKVLRVMVPACIIILSVPVVDLIVSGGRAYALSFLIPEWHGDLLQRFLTFFGPHEYSGASPGMRFEIAVAILMAGLYVFHKRRSLMRAILAALGTYTITFLFIAFPYVLQAIGQLIGIPLWVPQDPHQFAIATGGFLFIALVALGFMAFRSNLTQCLLILRDIRPARLLHYWLMCGIGIAVAYHGQTIDGYEFFTLLYALVAIAAAWVFSLITNNMADLDTDSISNAGRPLVRGALSAQEYRVLAFLALGVALTCALASGFITFLVICFFIGNYFLYSMPPLRLKKLTYVSKLLIILNSAVLVLLGMVLTDSALVYQLPDIKTYLQAAMNPVTLSLFFAITLLLTLAVNFIDIKDYAGDKHADIKTLPVLLGLRIATALIGGSFFILYALLGWWLGGAYIALGLAAGAAQTYFITRRTYDERYVFALYIPTLILLCLLF